MTKKLMRQRNWLIASYWLFVAALFGWAMDVVAFHTPDDVAKGAIQKVFYLHIPAATSTLLGCLVVFLASAGYLWHRKSGWDDLAASAAKVTVVLCTVVLLTGMIWGRGAWGRWWTWNPRLTFSLMLWLLYVGYLILRNAIESAQRRAVAAAVYGIIASLDVPLVYLSACMMPETHPSPAELDPAMQFALLAMFIPVTLAAMGLVATRYLVARDETARAELARCGRDDSSQTHRTVAMESLLQAAGLEARRD